VADLLKGLWQAALYGACYLAMVAGVLAIPLGFPGQFLVPVAAAGLRLAVGRPSWAVVGVAFGLAVLAEVAEALAGFWGAGRARGGFWSGVAALGGGVAGAVLGSFAAPVAGSVLGALAGTFAGAYLVEYRRTRAGGQAARVGRGAVVGRVLGSAAKVVMAVVMMVVVTVGLFA